MTALEIRGLAAGYGRTTVLQGLDLTVSGAGAGSGGFGLGLSLVAAAAERHHAVLRLEDAHPGLKVSVTFPP